MAPGEYNSVYVNILKSYSSLLNSSTISPDMEGLIQNYQDINGGGEPAFKLLVDINSKKFDSKLYDQTKACLNKAVDVYNKSKLNNPDLIYSLYHKLINISNVVCSDDLKKSNSISTLSNHPEMVLFIDYLNHLTLEQHYSELKNTATILQDIGSLKSIEFFIKCAYLSKSSNKTDAVYNDHFETIYRILDRFPVLFDVQKDRLDEQIQAMFENSKNGFFIFVNLYNFSTHLLTVFEKNSSKFVVINALYYKVLWDMYVYIGNKYFDVNDSFKGESCRRAAYLVSS